MYTFYFQEFADCEDFRLAALKGPKIPTGLGWPELGKEYDIFSLFDLTQEGYRVVILPQFQELHSEADRMFYADGYRGVQLGDKADYIDWSMNDIAKEAGHVSAAEYAKFIDYANGGSVPDWCAEDFGAQKSGQERASVPEPSSENLQESADNAKPQIGPLPGVASLAPTSFTTAPPANSYTMTWTYSDYTPWSKEHGTLPSPNPPIPEGSMLLPKLTSDTSFAKDVPERKIEHIVEGRLVRIADPIPEKPSWWALLKNWIKTDF